MNILLEPRWTSSSRSSCPRLSSAGIKLRASLQLPESECHLPADKRLHLDTVQQTIYVIIQGQHLKTHSGFIFLLVQKKKRNKGQNNWWLTGETGDLYIWVDSFQSLKGMTKLFYNLVYFLDMPKPNNPLTCCHLECLKFIRMDSFNSVRWARHGGKPLWSQHWVGLLVSVGLVLVYIVSSRTARAT